jgi:hypothetical protein
LPGGQTFLTTDVPVDGLIDAAKASNQFTVELWLTPRDPFGAGPDRIVVVGNATGATNAFMVGRGGDTLSPTSSTTSIRFRSGPVPPTSNLIGPPGSSPAQLHHLVVTYDGDSDRGHLYVNRGRFQIPGMSGDLDYWSSDVLRVGGIEVSERSFLGDLHYLAIHDHVMGNAEVEARYAQGPGHGLAGLVRDKLVVEYRFLENAGSELYDLGLAAKANIFVEDPTRTTWRQRGLQVVAPGTNARSPTTIPKLFDECTGTNELTVEAWLTPDSDSTTNVSRVVAFSPDNGDGDATNFMLVQEGARYGLRLRTSGNGGGDISGHPERLSDGDDVLTSKQHVVFTYKPGDTHYYLNGGERGVSNELAGSDFGNWDATARLWLGDEPDEPEADRNWIGEYHYVAVHCAALTAAEVANHYALGDGH